MKYDNLKAPLACLVLAAMLIAGCRATETKGPVGGRLLVYKVKDSEPEGECPRVNGDEPVPPGKCVDSVSSGSTMDAGPGGNGPAPALPPRPVGLVLNGDRSLAKVAVTFDACESRSPTRFDQAIWDVVQDKKIKITVFLGGKWMESHPEETAMLARSPLVEIGNHSYGHPDFRKISSDQAREEIKRTQDIQWKLTGTQGVVFRFPYGRYDQRSLEIVAESGLYAIQWDTVSGDPDKRVDAGMMTDMVLDEVKNGSIIIFHINGRGWHTAEALPKICDELRARGFEFVTVSELMEYETAPLQTARHNSASAPAEAGQGKTGPTH